MFETTPFFSFHHVNAFEASEGRLVVDTVAMTGIDFGNSTESGISIFEGKAGKGVVTRLVIDGKTGQVWLIMWSRMSQNFILYCICHVSETPADHVDTWLFYHCLWGFGCIPVVSLREWSRTGGLTQG